MGRDGRVDWDVTPSLLYKRELSVLPFGKAWLRISICRCSCIKRVFRCLMCLLEHCGMYVVKLC